MTGAINGGREEQRDGKNKNKKGPKRMDRPQQLELGRGVMGYAMREGAQASNPHTRRPGRTQQARAAWMKQQAAEELRRTDARYQARSRRYGT